MKIASWNVNSLRVRLPQVLDWLAANPIDVLALQETKLVDGRFPVEALHEAGFAAAFAGQPTYNGVALLTRLATVGEPRDVRIGNPHLPDDEQQRLITARIGDVDVTSAYFPNGQALDSPKYQYKLEWIDALLAWLEATREGAPRLVLGDFNIAPDDRDVHDPAGWEGNVLVSAPERERFQRLLELGFVDAFRCFEQEDAQFSWWDYRQGAFRRNAGLRIDIALVDERLRERILGCTIDPAPRRLKQPSDHTPVIVELA